MGGWSEFSAILKPSTISGIGVFAIHDIDIGVQVLPKFSPREAKISDIPAEFLSYCISLDDEKCLCPKEFDRMEIGWYLNHSKNPNVEKRADGNVYTIMAIKAGEEILIDYNQFGEPENLKEPYMKC
ncbi:MAG: SET domain-containing protein-lysine N-methyltransferase [Chlamydiota bacterium]